MSPATSANRKFQLRLWLAEARLRVDLEPELARNEVEALLNDLPPNSPLDGVATLDLGITLFATGRYRLAERTLTDLLASKCGGYDRNGAALLAKHANACAGYHEERAKAGITEPSHIDPLCGASGLAIALRHLGRPHKKFDLAAETPHTGFGSSMQNLVVGAKNLGLRGYPLSMDGKALRTYFTVNQGIPVIAHVEHDHFIAVTAASAKGVTYWCSDCGPWPGGKRTVTWKQWTLMEPDGYLGIAVPGSDLDVALARLGQPTPERVAFIGAIASGPILAVQVGRAQQILSLLRTASIGYVSLPYSLLCGMMPQSDQCPPCEVECPYPVVAGSATADPVNLANGAEEYTAPSALHVYNPSGPSVTWTHSYNSLARTVPNGWGQGWHHPYLLSLFLEHHPDPEGPGDTSGFIYFPNSAQMPLVFPSSSAPQTVGQSYAGTVQAFMPYLAAWRNDPVYGEVIELTSKGRTKYLFKRKDQKLNNTNAWQWMLTSIVDRNGLRIDLEWTPMTFREWNWLTLKYQGHGLTSIKDSSGSPLLTLVYEDLRLVSVSDRYGRSIYYTVANFANTGVTGNYPQDPMNSLAPR